MSKERKYRKYTAADIEKYHKGLLSAKEMNDLEKTALDDPFLADALEGYGTTPVDISTDLPELEKKLDDKVNKAKVISLASRQNLFKWWKIAAAVVIIGGAGFLAFRFSTSHKKDSAIAILEEKKSKEPVTVPAPDSNKLLKQETTGVQSSIKALKTSTPRPVEKKKPDELQTNDARENDDGLTSTTITPAASSPEKEQNDSANREKNARSYNAAAAKAPTVAESNRQLKEPDYNKKENAQNDQQRVNYFRGRVTDANNNALPFANITNTRDNVGTYADAKGNFTLISPDSVLDVQVRSLGFENNFTRLRNNVPNNKVILQEDEAAPDKILSGAANGSMKSEEPEPADGWANYNTYLANNINMPGDSKMNQQKGLVELSFEVNQNGNAVNIRVEKSLCPKCDEEAVRLVKEGPKWKKKNKKAKRTTIAVPFEANR